MAPVMSASREIIRGTTPSVCPHCQQMACDGWPHFQTGLSPFNWIMSSSPVASAPANQQKTWGMVGNGIGHRSPTFLILHHHQHHSLRFVRLMLLLVEATPSNGSTYSTGNGACNGKSAMGWSPKVTSPKLHHRQRHSPRIDRLLLLITEAIPNNGISGNSDDGIDGNDCFQQQQQHQNKAETPKISTCVRSEGLVGTCASKI